MGQNIDQLSGDQNRTTTYQYDANDRLPQSTDNLQGATTPTITPYQWDARGNLASKTQGGQTTTYHWRSDNRLQIIGVRSKLIHGDVEKGDVPLEPLMFKTVANSRFFTPEKANAVASLLEQFIKEEENSYVRDLILKAVHEDERHPHKSLQKFEFNRFDVTLDFIGNTALLEDIIDPLLTGAVQLPLGEFVARVAEAGSEVTCQPACPDGG